MKVWVYVNWGHHDKLTNLFPRCCINYRDLLVAFFGSGAGIVYRIIWGSGVLSHFWELFVAFIAFYLARGPVNANTPGLLSHILGARLRRHPSHQDICDSAFYDS